MNWREKVINTFETLNQVQVLIEKVINKIYGELEEVYDKIDRNNGYLIGLDHDTILKKLLQRNRTLRGLTEEKIYKIVTEMILEKTEFDEIIKQLSKGKID